MGSEVQSGEQYWQVVQPVWRSISIYGTPEEFLREFRAVPVEVGHLFAAHWCQSEVRNGGLHQFFSNSTGILAPEALEAFRAIGLKEWAAILEEAMRFFGKPYPRGQAKRLELLANVPDEKREEWDPFDQLDDRFFEWLLAEDNRFDRVADEYAKQVST